MLSTNSNAKTKTNANNHINNYFLHPVWAVCIPGRADALETNLTDTDEGIIIRSRDFGMLTYWDYSI